MGAGMKPPIVADMPCGKPLLSNVAGRRRVRSSIISCTRSDHAAVGNFLMEIFGSSCAAEFHASLDDPLYAPGDRLLLRRMGTAIAHVHITQRIMQFGTMAIPVAGVHGLATAANCRRQGLGTHLLLAAERQMARSGAMVGFLRTRIPHFFRRTGWALCGDSAGCAASPHAVLARFHERGCGLRRTRHIQIRPWRRWEEDAIARVYRQSQSGSFGMLERNRAYWHWLLERGACDQFYVALDGRDLWDFKESSTQVVGYAAIKGEKIIELAVAPDCSKAGLELLARACGDAIEQDHRQIALCARQTAATWNIFTVRQGPRPQGCMRSSAWRGCWIRWGYCECFVVRWPSGLPRPDSPGRWNWDCSSTGGSTRWRSRAAAAR